MHKIKLIAFVSLLICPSLSYAFPAPEAMGAISFALSSVWAHLSAILGSILGIRSGAKQDSESIQRAYVFFLSLLLLSICINIFQFYLASDRSAYANEVNFQKVQPVPFPNVKREFNSEDHHYKLTIEAYLSNQDNYVLYPVVTEKEYQENRLQLFKDNDRVVILNPEGEIVNHPIKPQNKTVVFTDWNNDLSRIAINYILTTPNNNSKSYYWLEGGYRELLDRLKNDSDESLERISPSELKTYDQDKNALFIDVTEHHAFNERGYFYSAINRPYSMFFSGELDLYTLAQHEGPVVFLDFYESKSKAVALWYQQKTGNKAYILDGGYEHLTEKGLDWVPYYPNRYRILSEQQVYDWYIGTKDVLFLDGRSIDEYKSSKEQWIAMPTPVEYDTLDELYEKVKGLDKNKRYAGFVYDQGNAFKMLVLGHALHKEGYTWLGIYTRPEFLSFAEIDDFSKNRPHRIELWQTGVQLKEFYPKLLGEMSESLNLPLWGFLLAYGFLFRFCLLPITYWTSQPALMKKTLSKKIQIGSNFLYIGILIIFAMFVQKWLYDFGDAHWSVGPLQQSPLLDSNLIWTIMATGLIGVQLSVTPGLSLLSTPSRRIAGGVSLIVIGYLLSGLTAGLLIYISGITIASIVLAFVELTARIFKSPAQRKDLPVIKTDHGLVSLVSASEANEQDHGIKAGRLGQLYRDGHSVPLFFFLNQREFKKLSSDQDRRKLYSFAKRFGNRLIVRSAAVKEDASASKIGRYDSKPLSISDLTPNEFCDVISSVFESQTESPECERQVIIQKFISGEKYLVATSRDINNPENSRIEYGDHESVTEGHSINEVVLSDKEADEGPYSRIHRLIRSLEKRFLEPLDVELVISEGALFILQVRPFHPLKYCQPCFYEELSHELMDTEIKEIHRSKPISDAGGSPSPLSISILKALYGETLITRQGIPYLLPTKKKRFLMTFNQFQDNLKTISRAASKLYDTIIFLKLNQLEDDALISYYKDCFEILENTLKLSEQLRVSSRLQKKIKQLPYPIGYWAEDQSNLSGRQHSPKFFLSNADFNVRRTIPSLDEIQAKPSSLRNTMDKYHRVITDVHYLTARIYTAISMLVNEIDNRINARFDTHPGVSHGMTHNELLAKQWSNPSLWESRSRALSICQQKIVSDTPMKNIKSLGRPIESIIFKPENDELLGEIPNNSLLIMNYGRSDIIPEMENISAILCKNGGENSHWMMVARSYGIYAISGDSSLNIDDWEHGCRVTLLT